MVHSLNYFFIPQTLETGNILLEGGYYDVYELLGIAIKSAEHYCIMKSCRLDQEYVLAKVR